MNKNQRQMLSFRESIIQGIHHSLTHSFIHQTAYANGFGRWLPRQCFVRDVALLAGLLIDTGYTSLLL